jgi:hypothetical protein
MEGLTCVVPLEPPWFQATLTEPVGWSSPAEEWS